MPDPRVPLCCLVSAFTLPAQGAAATIAEARSHADAGEFELALARLVDLPVAPLTAAERQQAGDLLVALGERFRVDGELAQSVQAHTAALALRTALHADAPHRDVADSASEIAELLLLLGRARDARPHYELALGVQRQLHRAADHIDVARAENNFAYCLTQLDDLDAALPHAEAALAICRRLAGDRDDPGVAHCLDTLANCLRLLDRAGAALPLLEESLAMRQRLAGGTDHPAVEQSLNNLAVCLRDLGRFDDALLRLDEALAVHARLRPDAASPAQATRLGNRASLLSALGRAREALPVYEAALAMRRRVLGAIDHPSLAGDISNLGFCLDALGRADQALPLHEQALVMRRRLDADADSSDIASSLNNLACTLQSLGRHAEALPLYEESAAMLQRIHGERPHSKLATYWNNAANCLTELGRTAEALALQRRSLAMQRLVHEDRDHPEIAQALHNLGFLLDDLGDHEAAQACLADALAMRRRLFGDGDHPDVASSLQGRAHVLRSRERIADALATYGEALAMRRRLFATADHPELVGVLASIAACRVELGRWQDAADPCAEACAMIERLRERSLADRSLRQSLFDALKRDGPFELLQAIRLRLDDVEGAFEAAERSRSRDLLDLCEQQRFDPLVEALRRAQLRGDQTAATAIETLRRELADADEACDRALHAVTQGDASDAATRAEGVAALERAHAARRRLLDQHARLCGDVLPVGRVRTAAEIRAVLRDGEALLEFTLATSGSIAYLLTRDRVEAFVLPHAHEAVQRLLPDVVQRLARAGGDAARGRDPAGNATAPAAADRTSEELFAALIPPALWSRLRELRSVHVAAHRGLHRLPFEALVTGTREGLPVYWLDVGPALGYVPSGSTLGWLHQRAAAASDDPTDLDLLVVGDPASAPDVALPPGAYVVAVDPDGPGARAGLLPRDVVTAYDGQPVADDRGLRELRTATEVRIEDGDRADAPIPLEVWRRGALVRIAVAKGPLGVEVARGAADALASPESAPRVTRAGDLEQLHRLPALLGARAEADAIERVFRARQLRVTKLLGDAATEPAVFDLAAKARYVHFACHGIAEEYAGQSFSMLVLARPERLLPDDDGLLQLHELLGTWRGRLSASRLVVLSACRTNVGPTLRDEAPQALPTGLLFAGASAVVSSLWAVDDSSTRELMTDFYGRLAADDGDRLQAFHAAKRALRRKHGNPYHWAPFLYLGSPD
jgi:tetratricopeptide (TPR) repeat protein